MAEYRRFISYIYAYEGDMKTKNVGFAKIEARNGQCRISISIKGAYECSGQELSLYGYGYREAGCLLVPLGQIPVKNGTGEAVFGKQEENLSGSGYGLSFIKGLYLRSRVSVQKAYLTTWDDTVIHIGALRNARIAGEEERLAAASLPETAAAGPLTGMEVFKQAERTTQAEPMKTELLQPESLKAVLREAASLSREPSGEAPGEPLKPPKQSPEESQAKESAERLRGQEPPEPGASGEEESKRGGESGTHEGQEAKPQTEGEMKVQAEPEAKVRAGREEREAGRKTGPATGEAGKARQETAGEAGKAQQEAAAAAAGRMPENFYFREGFPELPLWECLQKILPRKRVLAEAGWEVLQIHIQDIGRLPRENWPYGNNSFVLHGYFQYRYLILARRQRQPAKRFQSGYQYILGVPGIFKPQEKFMASMFGLPEFKRAAGIRSEDFGFWCGSIQM